MSEQNKGGRASKTKGIEEQKYGWLRQHIKSWQVVIDLKSFNKG